jgi:hypothetical protein
MSAPPSFKNYVRTGRVYHAESAYVKDFIAPVTLALGACEFTLSNLRGSVIDKTGMITSSHVVEEKFMSGYSGLLFGVLGGGFIVMVFAGIGAFLIYYSFRSRKKADASQGWPSTNGLVTEARVSHSTSTDADGEAQDSYSPQVRYHYSIAGQEYEGSKISFGMQQSFSSRSKAEQALTSFPQGSQVALYYNPANPSEAVLERKAGGSTLSLVLGIIFLLVGLCIGCSGIVIALT